MGMGIWEALKIERHECSITAKAEPVRIVPSLSGNMIMRKCAFSCTSHKCTPPLHPSGSSCTLTHRSMFWQRYFMHSSTHFTDTCFRNTMAPMHSHRCANIHTHIFWHHMYTHMHTHTHVHAEGDMRCSYLLMIPWDSAMPLFLKYWLLSVLLTMIHLAKGGS